MAVDYSRFIVPEGDFSRLDKLGETLATQAAAKTKAEQEKKKLTEEGLKSTLSELQSKDFITNTLADKVIIDGLQKTQNKAYALSSAGYDYNQMKMALSDDVYNLTQKSQAAKNLATQLNANIERNKGVKGIDMNKYSSAMINAAFLQDGKVKDEFDPTQNYDEIVKKTADIYNADEAVAEDIKNMAKSVNKYDVQERGADKVLRKTLKNIETATGFEPYLDKEGVFQGVIPQHTEAPVTDSSKAVNDYITGQKDSKQPLNLITDDQYARIQSNPVIMGAVNKDTRDFAIALGRTPTQEEITTFQKAKLFDLYSRSSKAGFKHETAEAKLAPVTKVNVSTGGNKSGSSTIRDIHTPAVTLYGGFLDKKRKAVELFSQGKSTEEVAKAVNLDPAKSKSFLENAKKGDATYSMPLTTRGLDVEFVNSIVDNTNKSQNENEKKSRNELYVELNDKGEWEVLDASNNNYLLATIPATTLGVGAEQGAKSKNAYIQQKKTETSPTKKGGFKGTDKPMY